MLPLVTYPNYNLFHASTHFMVRTEAGLSDHCNDPKVASVEHRPRCRLESILDVFAEIRRAHHVYFRQLFHEIVGQRSHVEGPNSRVSAVTAPMLDMTPTVYTHANRKCQCANMALGLLYDGPPSKHNCHPSFFRLEATTVFYANLILSLEVTPLPCLGRPAVPTIRFSDSRCHLHIQRSHCDTSRNQLFEQQCTQRRRGRSVLFGGCGFFQWVCFFGQRGHLGWRCVKLSSRSYSPRRSIASAVVIEHVITGLAQERIGTN